MDESSSMDETEYLLSSEKNAEHLERSIEQANNILNNPIVDSQTVLSLMENMSVSELKMLKISCDLLIGFKENGATIAEQFKSE